MKVISCHFLYYSRHISLGHCLGLWRVTIMVLLLWSSSAQCADNIYDHGHWWCIQGFENSPSSIKIKLAEVEGPTYNALGHFIVKFSRFSPSVAIIIPNIKHLGALNFTLFGIFICNAYFFSSTFLRSLLDSWATRWKRLGTSMLNLGLCCCLCGVNHTLGGLYVLCTSRFYLKRPW